MGFSLVALLAGAIFAIAGLIQLKFPPSKINTTYGYRTQRSMKSEAHWQFAQRYAAQRMLMIGGIQVACGLVGYLVKLPDATGAAIATGLMVSLVIWMTADVEHQLKKQFGK